MTTDPTLERLRLAELMACLAAACDLSFGRSADFSLRSCALSLRLAEAWGLQDSDLRHVYCHALLRFIGCNADTAVMAAIAGDVIELRRAGALLDLSDKAAIGALLEQRIRATVTGATPAEVDAAVMRGMARASEFRHEIFPGHCEVAQRLGQRLGFDERFISGLGQVYARWDGQGVPAVAGEALLPAVRVVILVQELLLHHDAGGWERAAVMLRQRSGAQFDPALCALLLKRGPELLQSLPTRWDQLLALEPGAIEHLEGEALDSALRVLADHADIQSPWLLCHSARVATLAEGAARQLGMDGAQQRTLRRAALVYDIGRVAISADLWGRPAALAPSEWVRVRMQCHYSAQILSPAPTLAGFAWLAGAHEPLDGGGCVRGLDAQALSPVARVLAAASVVAALGEARAHRPAFDAEGTARVVGAEVAAGRLDRDAVAAVLACLDIDTPLPAAKAELPTGLSPREAEVLAGLTQSLSHREIARRLGKSPKAVAHQAEALFRKSGVRTRAGATLYAMEQGLVAPAGVVLRRGGLN